MTTEPPRPVHWRHKTWNCNVNNHRACKGVRLHRTNYGDIHKRKCYCDCHARVDEKDART